VDFDNLIYAKNSILRFIGAIPVWLSQT